MTPETTLPMTPSTDPCTPPNTHSSTISTSVQPSTVTNPVVPAPIDLRMQSFTIIKENGETQRSSLWPMYKTGRETIKEVFDLDHEKFLAAMKKDGGFNISKDVIFCLLRSRSVADRPFRWRISCTDYLVVRQSSHGLEYLY